MHDHRKLGRELALFDTDPLIGAGLPYWLPDGATVRHTLEEYIRTAERRAGYRHVYSPVLGKRELYEISGHWSHYSDDMFPPMDLGSEQVVLRPSLCPHHAVIYRSRSHSYRELPLRMAELGGMYRSELSGVLGGLTRVRAIQLNDAHIFCTLDQVADEARAALEMIRSAYESLGISPARYRLSLPGPGGKYVAAPEKWQRSTALLTEVLDRSGLPYDSAEGEAAFYGPKIDVQVTDGAGRSPPCPPSRSTSTSPSSSTCTTSARTARSTGRSWSTAASSAAWSGPSPISSNSTAAPFPPGSPRPSWRSFRSPRRNCPTPWPWPSAAPTAGCGPRSPGRNAAPWAPVSGRTAWCPTKS